MKLVLLKSIMEHQKECISNLNGFIIEDEGEIKEIYYPGKKIDNFECFLSCEIIGELDLRYVLQNHLKNGKIYKMFQGDRNKGCSAIYDIEDNFYINVELKYNGDDLYCNKLEINKLN